MPVEIKTNNFEGVDESYLQSSVYPRMDDATEKESEGGCWEWSNSTRSSGYGSIWIDGQSWTAHRASFVRHRGPIPEGLTLDHLCRNTSCINPDHLEPVTNRRNYLRGVAPGAIVTRTNRCLSGRHEMTQENTIRRPSRPEHRECRACARERQRKYLRKWRAQRRAEREDE